MNKRFTLRLLALLLLWSVVLPSAYGCEKQVVPKNRIFYQYFDTISTIYDYSGGSEIEFSDAAREFERRLEYYHKLFDIYNEYEGMNNVATINRLAGKEAVKVAPELIDFLLFPSQMHDKTDGNVNIAMGSVLSIWHNYREEGKVIPTKEELSAAALHTDISKMVINAEEGTVFLSDPEMSLDVGAIAKGYAVEAIAKTLKSLGYDHYVVDLGGNLRTIGTKADGGSWRTGVENPDPYAEEPYVYYLDVADTSVVTSGDYQRFYTVDGKKYHHIINKDTLMPAEYFSSVTVVTENSGVADALSTALFNMDYESGLALLSEFEGTSVVWVTRDGEVKTYGLDK